MRKIILILLFFCCQNAFSFSCDDAKPIIQKPILFNKLRFNLTQEYQRIHYGIHSSSIKIKPTIIVLHWTASATLKEALKIFYPPVLSSRPELPGALNVSAHFLVDRDGTIYQLMPDNWMARHVIGINHNAIGIENVGGSRGYDDLTNDQVEANAYLVCYLKRKYPAIQYLIGHMNYAQFKHTSLWLEKDSNYLTSKSDPGESFIRRVKLLIRGRVPH